MPDKTTGQSAAVDYEALYNKLYKEVQDANTQKKRLLSAVSSNVKELLGRICDPIPPGCSGNTGSGSYEQLAKEVQRANAQKKDELEKIDEELKQLAQRICDPIPPGCSR